jgi:hypothetical protein
LQTQRVLKALEQHNKQKKENIFYSTWDEKILKNFVENIINEFPEQHKHTTNTKNFKFNHLNI